MKLVKLNIYLLLFQINKLLYILYFKFKNQILSKLVLILKFKLIMGAC